MVDHKVTASTNTLMYQACETGNVYFGHAVSRIKKEMGVKELNVEMLKAAVDLASIMERDYNAASRLIGHQAIADSIKYLKGIDFE